MMVTNNRRFSSHDHVQSRTRRSELRYSKDVRTIIPERSWEKHNAATMHDHGLVILARRQDDEGR